MSRVFQASRSLLAAAASKSAPAASKSAPAAKPSTGIMKELPVSPELQEFIGASEVSRPQAVKKIWEHIKANNLQNPENKREIFCDAALKPVLGGKDKVTMLEIASLLTPHFIKTK